MAGIGKAGAGLTRSEPSVTYMSPGPGAGAGATAGIGAIAIDPYTPPNPGLP